MTRIIGFLVIVGIAALGVAWIADRPGDVVVTWPWLDQHWPGHGRIEISLITLAAAVLLAMAVIAIVWTLIGFVLRSPWILRRHLRHRRGVRAYEAISSGLIAVGAGDHVAARKFASEVSRLAPHEPLSLLLNAQAAQLSGDREGAERSFHAMAMRADTKALGLHGLFIEARRRNDITSARAFAEEAARTAPSLGWAGRAVLEIRSAIGDWTGALEILERHAASLGKALYQRQRAVLLTARALATEDNDRDAAKTDALEANRLAPDLVPAAALAGRLTAEGGELRKATRIIEKAWRANPHPDLAEAAAGLRYGDAARDKLERIEALARKAQGNIESALALARASLDAREFAKARSALMHFLAAPTKRVALLMAEIERAEHNDEGRARQWLARALHAAPDPAWTADGHVSDRWQPASPVTGRLDAFEWRVPVTGSLTTPVIEAEPPASVTAPVAIPPAVERKPDAAANTPPAAASDATTLAGEPPSVARIESITKAAAPEIPPNGPGPAKPEPKPEPIIPLIHAPDDPGPDEAAPGSDTQQSGWTSRF